MRRLILVGRLSYILIRAKSGFRCKFVDDKLKYKCFVCGSPVIFTRFVGSNSGYGFLSSRAFFIELSASSAKMAASYGKLNHQAEEQN